MPYIKPFIVVVICCSTSAADNCRVRSQNVVVAETGLAVVPFAIATPVAVVTPGSAMYSYRGVEPAYQATAQSQVNTPRAASSDDEYALWLEFLAWKRSRVQAAVVKQTAVQQSCVKCHSGDTPKGKLSLVGELSEKQRLAAIAAIVAGKMPKGPKITAQQRADLVGELSGVSVDESPKVQGAEPVETPADPTRTTEPSAIPPPKPVIPFGESK